MFFVPRQSPKIERRTSLELAMLIPPTITALYNSFELEASVKHIISVV